MTHNFRSTYSPANSYAKLDVVIYKKSTQYPNRFFLCILEHSNLNPQEPNPYADTDYWAVLNSESNFPENIDQFITHTNINALDVESVKRYQDLTLLTNRTTAEDEELNILLNSLRDKIILPEDWNKFQSALSNMQMFIKSGVEGYINQKQIEFKAYVDNKKNELSTAQSSAVNSMESKKSEFTTYVDNSENNFNLTLAKFSYQGNYSGTMQYYKWNTIKYNNESYLCILDSKGNDPTNITYWTKIAAKGDKGEQGLAGLGLVYLGSYDGTKSYMEKDAVNYGGSIYYCKANAPVGVNPSDQNYWSLFLSKQNIPISPTPPNTPAVNDMWVDESNNNPILKYWNGATWLSINASNSERLGGQLPSYYATTQSVSSHTSNYILHIPYATTAGSANTYTATLNPVPTSYVEGMAIAIKINVNNTGGSTLNINNLGAKSIKKANGSDVTGGSLKVGSIYTLRYNGTNFILQGEGGSGNAQPSDVLSGKTFTNDNGDQVGTIVNNGAGGIVTPSTVDQIKSAGYYTTPITVKGDPNLNAAYILAGKSIFGVNGSFAGKPFASGMSKLQGSSLIVTGLSFRPKWVYGWVTTAYASSATSNFFIGADGDVIDFTKEGGSTPLFYGMLAAGTNPTGTNFLRPQVTGASIQMNDTGFNLIPQFSEAGWSCKWFAIGA